MFCYDFDWLRFCSTIVLLLHRNTETIPHWWPNHVEFQIRFIKLLISIYLYLVQVYSQVVFLETTQTRLRPRREMNALHLSLVHFSFNFLKLELLVCKHLPHSHPFNNNFISSYPENVVNNIQNNIIGNTTPRAGIQLVRLWLWLVCHMVDEGTSSIPMASVAPLSLGRTEDHYYAN